MFTLATKRKAMQFFLNPKYFLYPALKYAGTFTLFSYYMQHDPNLCIMFHCFLDADSMTKR